MPTALQVAGTIVALLFFSLQDAAQAGKSTCDTELDINTPLPKKREKKLLQAKTSPKVSAAEVLPTFRQAVPQCGCSGYRDGDKCKSPKLKYSNCAGRKSKEDCEKKAACKWTETPRPTPKPTPAPTAEPTPVPTPLPTCVGSCNYKKTRYAICSNEDIETETFGFWIKSGGGDCRPICDYFPWCRGYTNTLVPNGDSDHKYRRNFVISRCELVVDQQLYLEKEGSFPSRSSEVIFKKADGTLWILTKRCPGNKCFDKVYGKGGLLPYEHGGQLFECYQKD